MYAFIYVCTAMNGYMHMHAYKFIWIWVLAFLIHFCDILKVCILVCRYIYVHLRIYYRMHTKIHFNAFNFFYSSAYRYCSRSLRDVCTYAYITDIHSNIYTLIHVYTFYNISIYKYICMYVLLHNSAYGYCSRSFCDMCTNAFITDMHSSNYTLIPVYTFYNISIYIYMRIFFSL
jgi:hypothetical protein